MPVIGSISKHTQTHTGILIPRNFKHLTKLDGYEMNEET